MTGMTGYNALLERICVGLGFCGCVKNGKSLHVEDIIPPDGPVTADQFVEWVFLADNMNPNDDSPPWAQIKWKIKEAFIECMGNDVVDAKFLREWTQ
jgi:hypothetical protein